MDRKKNIDTKNKRVDHRLIQLMPWTSLCSMMVYCGLKLKDAVAQCIVMVHVWVRVPGNTRSDKNVKLQYTQVAKDIKCTKCVNFLYRNALTKEVHGKTVKIIIIIIHYFY